MLHWAPEVALHIPKITMLWPWHSSNFRLV